MARTTFQTPKLMREMLETRWITFREDEVTSRRVDEMGSADQWFSSSMVQQFNGSTVHLIIRRFDAGLLGFLLNNVIYLRIQADLLRVIFFRFLKDILEYFFQVYLQVWENSTFRNISYCQWFGSKIFPIFLEIKNGQ